MDGSPVASSLSPAPAAPAAAGERGERGARHSRGERHAQRWRRAPEHQLPDVRARLPAPPAGLRHEVAGRALGGSHRSAFRGTRAVDTGAHARGQAQPGERAASPSNPSTGRITACELRVRVHDGGSSRPMIYWMLVDFARDPRLECGFRSVCWSGTTATATRQPTAASRARPRTGITAGMKAPAGCSASGDLGRRSG